MNHLPIRPCCCIGTPMASFTSCGTRCSPSWRSSLHVLSQSRGRWGSRGDDEDRRPGQLWKKSDLARPLLPPALASPACSDWEASLPHMHACVNQELDERRRQAALARNLERFGTCLSLLMEVRAGSGISHQTHGNPVHTTRSRSGYFLLHSAIGPRTTTAMHTLDPSCCS